MFELCNIEIICVVNSSVVGGFVILMMCGIGKFEWLEKVVKVEEWFVCDLSENY